MERAAATTDQQRRYKEFGERVRRFRLEAGYTSQESLARALDVSLFTITRYENGTQRPSFDGLYRLAEILGVQATDLLPDDPEADAA